MKASIVLPFVSAVAVPVVLLFGCGNGPTQAKEKISLTAPVAGQKVVAGDTLLVSWTQSVTNANLAYNFNQGAGWQTFASVIKADDNSIKAVLPTSSFTDSFQVQVEDNSGSYDAGVSAPFSIKYIVITYPAAGDTLSKGSTVTITWKDAPDKLSGLRIMLSTDGGKSFGDMLTKSVPIDQTTQTWVIGSELGTGAPFGYPSTNCILKIEDYSSANYNDETGFFSVQ